MNDLENISTLVGYTLRQLRLESGFKSYEQFAQQHNFSRIQYWKMENGNNFTLKSLLNVLNIHEISMRSFLLLIEGNSMVKTTGPGARLQKLIDYSQLSKKEFSLKIGYKNLTAVNKVVFGNKDISPIMLNKITPVFPEINLMWLKMGSGEMILKQ